MSIARHFKTLFFLALIGGLVAGAMLAQRGARVDLGTIAGVKLVLAAPAVTPTSQVPAGLFAQGTGTPGAAQGAATGAGRGATGTVQSVSGNTISVTAQDGVVTKAAVSGSTTYVKNGAITVADLKAGDAVTVVGAAGADGTITATQMAVGGVGQAAAGGAFNRQGGAGGQGATGAGRSGGAGAGQFANLATLSGSVQKVDGDVVTVAVDGGQPTRVVLAANTRLTKAAPAALADVTVGEQVTIVGQAGADGIVAAVLVQIGALR